LSLIFEMGPNNSRPQHSTAGYRCRAHGACPVSATTWPIPNTKYSDAVIVGGKPLLEDLPKLRLSQDTCSSGVILARGGCLGWGSQAKSVWTKMHGVEGKPSSPRRSPSEKLFRRLQTFRFDTCSSDSILARGGCSGGWGSRATSIRNKMGKPSSPQLGSPGDPSEDLFRRLQAFRFSNP